MEAESCQRCCIPGQCPFRLQERLFQRVQELMQWRRYSARCTVFRQNQPAQGLFVVQVGRLGLYSVTRGIKSHLGDAVPGWILGAGETLDGSSYFFSAEAEVETELEFLAKEELLSLLESHPETATALLVSVAQRSNELIAKMLNTEAGTATRTPPNH